MDGLFIPGMSHSALEELIRKVVREEIKCVLPPPTPHSRSDQKLISRKVAAEILSVSLPTLHDWSVRGILPSYRIGTRIRYKKEEILDALIRVESPTSNTKENDKLK